MMKRPMAAFSISIALILALATFSSVVAAPPQYVHIEAHEYIGHNGEAFSASGPAVDAGLVCASGTTYDESVDVGSTSGSFTILRVLKRFDCDGGDYVRLVVQLDNTTRATTASWRVVSGTGAYASLRANGLLVGTPGVPGVDIYDVYDGIAH